MKKLTSIILPVLVLALYACSDDNEDGYTREEIEKEIKTVSDDLKVKGASVFASVLATLDPEEVGTGELTVFAVKDGAYQTRATTITQNNIKRHIVRGKLTLSELKSHRTLTALNGEELIIETDGNDVYVNDVVLGQSSSVGNSVVYYIDEEIEPLDQAHYIDRLVLIGSIYIMNQGEREPYIPGANISVRFYDKRGNLLTTATADQNGKFENRYESPERDTKIDAASVTYDVVFPGYSNLFEGWVVLDYAWHLDSYFGYPEKYPDMYPKYTFGLILWDKNNDGVIDDSDKVARAPIVDQWGELRHEIRILLVPDDYRWPDEEII